ncbi:MAG: alpha-L-fucosidase [Clostridia bacterium]|nr:alpha-L-fucosidase [Clostridia bacterium]
MDQKDRFYHQKWGVFNHFLATIQNNPLLPNSYGKKTDWDTLVNEFDTELVAETLHRMGAGYYVITVMQGSQYMLAPNATFDRIAGTKPGEACSNRDLILDLYQSLSKYGIDLFLYFTGDGPYLDHPAGDRFGFVEPRKAGVPRPFVEKWASVLEEYALRYGTKIKGWWIDGCYKSSFKYTDELLELYYKACKKGNPDALVALNNGVHADGIAAGYAYEDFLCGERNDFDFIPAGRFYGNAQAHILAPLGTVENNTTIPPQFRNGWGCFGLRRRKEYLADYLQKVHQAGGVLTFDIGVYRDGRFDPEQVETLTYVGTHQQDA